MDLVPTSDELVIISVNSKSINELNGFMQQEKEVGRMRRLNQELKLELERPWSD